MQKKLDKSDFHLYHNSMKEKSLNLGTSNMVKGLKKVSLEKSGKIEVAIPYNPKYIKKIKGIKGHRWNPEKRCWFFPKSDNIVEQLIDIFKTENLLIDPSLRQGKEETALFMDLRREMLSRKYSQRQSKSI